MRDATVAVLSLFGLREYDLLAMLGIALLAVGLLVLNYSEQPGCARAAKNSSQI